jgi:NAD(P)-dependent dehydrogenase (short-subunit alcohol dehydrogenase family)
MTDLILTGASRGIGRALALDLAAVRPSDRLFLVARDQPRLAELIATITQKGDQAAAIPADLSSLEAAQAAGRALAARVKAGATLVHNAGVWPAQRCTTANGFESAFAINHLGPLAIQRVLLDTGRLSRIMVVSAGLIALGRFDPECTPSGADFSSLRTYCTSKLCFALAMRDIAAAYPSVDVVVLHPGVVRTDLGARSGPLGRLLALVKRRWETPELCAARLARILARPRWSPAGEARWLVEEKEQPWPAVADNEHTRQAVRETTARLLAAG